MAGRHQAQSRGRGRDVVTNPLLSSRGHGIGLERWRGEARRREIEKGGGREEGLEMKSGRRTMALLEQCRNAADVPTKDR